MTPAGATDPKVYDALSGTVRDTVVPSSRYKKARIFRGLNKKKVITNADGSQSIVPVTDFFEKYGTLLKLGTVGATLLQQQCQMKKKNFFYDPK